MKPLEGAEAASQLPTGGSPVWLDLPTAARDWVTPGQRYAYYLRPNLIAADAIMARERLTGWDALAGRLLRESLFGSTDRDVARATAEAVAAVAEQIAVALGDRP